MHRLRSLVFRLHVGQDRLKKKKKALKRCQFLFEESLVLFIFFFSFSLRGQGEVLGRIKARSLGEQSYCKLNQIKGRSAFKCLLFPWAKRLWASLLLPVRPAQTPPPLDAINIERIPWPALPSYHNSVRTKVNALNLISVLVIFNGVLMQAEGYGYVEGGQVWREIGSQSSGCSDGSRINYWSL